LIVVGGIVGSTVLVACGRVVVVGGAVVAGVVDATVDVVGDDVELGGARVVGTSEDDDAGSVLGGGSSGAEVADAAPAFVASDSAAHATSTAQPRRSWW
jgi:hypothetical protein